MTTLLDMARKQLASAYQSLTEEIEPFTKLTSVTTVTPKSGYKTTEVVAWALSKLEKEENIRKTGVEQEIRKALVDLIRQANTLEDVTRAWTLYEEVWEQEPMSSQATAAKNRDFRRRVIRAGQVMVDVLYKSVDSQGLELELPYRSIMVVPFLNRFYTGGFDSPAPYIVTPRWGYTQPWNWPAYAHEVGHHVYRNVRGLSDELKVNLIHHLLAQGCGYSMLSLWFNWLEEIFADLFGLLQLGSAFARTQQYIVLLTPPRSSIRNLTEGADPRTFLLHAYDFTHPTSYLRVELARKALATADQDTFKLWDDFFAGMDPEHIYVQTFELDDTGTISSVERKEEKTETLREIGHQVLQLIRDTPLYSLADPAGQRRKVKDVFSRPLPPVPETEEATELPDDMDIRDAVRWAVHAFERQELDKLKDNSEKTINRFAPAITVPSVGFESYTAQEGDTIKKMAEKLYDDPNKYELIRSANNLGREDKIEVGREYMIPIFS